MKENPFNLFGKDKDNLKANDEHDDLAINHDSNLYDQNEDRSGEKRDLATGLGINNDQEAGSHSTHTVIEGPERKDALPPLKKKKLDPAEEWLRKNDPNYKK